jgi:hypothetical protein
MAAFPPRDGPPPINERPIRGLQLTPNPTPAGPRPIVVHQARLLPAQREEVPSERDGQLLFLGTDLREDEPQPPADQIITAEIGFLAVEVAPGEEVRAADQVDAPNLPRKYRRWKAGDDLIPGEVIVGRQRKEFRKLHLGERVSAGQLLALVNPALALDELAVKHAKLEANEADRRAAAKTRDEARRRAEAMHQARLRSPGSFSDDDYRAAVLACQRYTEEEVAKASAVRQAQVELSAAVTTLRMHEIRSAIPGVVKALYKSPGEAVKSHESVLQVENPDLLLVEGSVEIQQAGKLRKGMPVLIEPARLEAPQAVLHGHLHEVTCVAVSRGPRPKIISGSEDRTLRVWERLPGQQPWRQAQ